MSELIDQFRAKLSEELISSISKKDQESVSTLRGIMSALDNASALTPDEISKLPDAGKSEVPRKILSQFDIEQVLLKEIVVRENAKADFERLGNSAQAALIGKSIELISGLEKYL